MLLTLRNAPPGSREFLDSRESLLTRSDESSRTDSGGPPSYNSGISSPPSYTSEFGPPQRMTQARWALKKPAPSYLRRLFGVANATPARVYRENELWDVPTSDLVANTETQVRAYFNTHWGCKPDDYRPGMARRFYVGSHGGCVRGFCFYTFEQITKAEPAFACRIMRQALAPPMEDEQDAEITRLILKDDIFPFLRWLAEQPEALSDQAMRDLVLALGYMEKHFASHKHLRKEIQRLKLALFS